MSAYHDRIKNRPATLSESLHAIGITPPNQHHAARHMKLYRLGIPDGLPWWKEAILCVGRSGGIMMLLLMGALLLLATSRAPHDATPLALALMGAACALAVYTSRNSKHPHSLFWRSVAYRPTKEGMQPRLWEESVRMPSAVQRVGERVREMLPHAELEVLVLGADPVLKVSASQGKEEFFLAGWDGDEIFFIAQMRE